jgi:hypothetical protein
MGDELATSNLDFIQLRGIAHHVHKAFQTSQQSDAEFNARLDAYVQSIFEGSNT